MPGFAYPNHTEVPNDFFDDMLAEIGEAELRFTLAIIRATRGYHVMQSR